MINESDLVYKTTAFIPKGKVFTYSSLAKLAGIKSPRVVGSLLHKNTDPEKIPCHRIVNSKGAVAANYVFGGARQQIKKLRKEGVEITGGKISLSKYLWRPAKIFVLYLDLLKKYGEPGPWPWSPSSRSSSGQVPSTPDEIVVGAILTQNTNWRNVETALENLEAIGPITIEQIYSLGRGDFEKLKALVRPSGFYNQKADRLFSLSKYLIENFQGLRNFFKLPLKQARENLLAIKGIGKETADTILLYAGNEPAFVIDSYTKRFAREYKLCSELDYEALQKLFVESLPKNLRVYQDYHASIVKWGKEN